MLVETPVKIMLRFGRECRRLASRNLVTLDGMNSICHCIAASDCIATTHSRSRLSLSLSLSLALTTMQHPAARSIRLMQAFVVISLKLIQFHSLVLNDGVLLRKGAARFFFFHNFFCWVLFTEITLLHLKRGFYVHLFGFYDRKN